MQKLLVPLSLVALAACGSSAQGPAGGPTTPPVGKSGGAPTDALRDYLSSRGHLSDEAGSYQLALERADGCAIVLLWNATMNNGTSMRYEGAFNLATVSKVGIELDKETGKYCIKASVPDKAAHLTVHLEMPDNKPLDTPMDMDNWGVCTERAFLDGLSEQIQAAAKSCGGMR